jgi:hypothetical protein
MKAATVLMTHVVAVAIHGLRDELQLAVDL